MGSNCNTARQGLLGVEPLNSLSEWISGLFQEGFALSLASLGFANSFRASRLVVVDNTVQRISKRWASGFVK